MRTVLSVLCSRQRVDALQMKEGVRLLSNTGRFNLISSDGVEAGIRVLKRFQQARLTVRCNLRMQAGRYVQGCLHLINLT